MIAALVAVCKLVVFAIKSVWYIAVAATTSPSVNFQDDIIAYPSAVRAIGLPSYGSPFPVRFVANVLLEVDAIVNALSDERGYRSANWRTE